MPDTGELYRNWKGYLVWAERCRNADGGDGYASLILTGPRAGEREWRSARSWDSSPHVAPGLPRYEPVPDPIPWCPLVQALAVFRELYPAAPAVPVVWDPEHEGLGSCFYAGGRATTILINPRLSLLEAAEVLIHELAHVIVDPTVEADEHGPQFVACHARLLAAYELRNQLKSKIPGMTWTKGSAK